MYSFKEFLRESKAKDNKIILRDPNNLTKVILIGKDRAVDDLYELKKDIKGIMNLKSKKDLDLFMKIITFLGMPNDSEKTLEYGSTVVNYINGAEEEEWLGMK